MTKTDNVMKKYQTICDAAQTVIDPMSDGTRKSIKDIADAVALSLQMEPKRVLNCVNDFLHDTEYGYVTRGKNGGFIKGKRPVKVVKLGAIVAPPTIDSTVDIDEDTDLEF